MQQVSVKPMIFLVETNGLSALHTGHLTLYTFCIATFGLFLGHSDIAPTRKQDPGPKFPWKKLYEDYQVGMWYDDAVMQSFLSQINPETYPLDNATTEFIYNYQLALKKLGYGIDANGRMDDTTKKTIEAFQYHFRPEKYDGVMDAESWAILQALNQKSP
jgi:N-acetylmuramoyl-L-alanine amidase